MYYYFYLSLPEVEGKRAGVPARFHGKNDGKKMGCPVDFLI